MSEVVYLDERSEKVVTLCYRAFGCVSLFTNVITLFVICTRKPTSNNDTMFWYLLSIQCLSLAIDVEFFFLFCPIALFPTVQGGYCTGFLCFTGGAYYHYHSTVLFSLYVQLGGVLADSFLKRHQMMLRYRADSWLLLTGCRFRLFIIALHTIYGVYTFILLSAAPVECNSIKDTGLTNTQEAVWLLSRPGVTIYCGSASTRFMLSTNYGTFAGLVIVAICILTFIHTRYLLSDTGLKLSRQTRKCQQRMLISLLLQASTIAICAFLSCVVAFFLFILHVNSSHYTCWITLIGLGSISMLNSLFVLTRHPHYWQFIRLICYNGCNRIRDSGPYISTVQLDDRQ